MKIDILTLFPEMFQGPFEESILKRAQEKGLVEINIHNLRKWTKDKRGTVDDRPYGGGVGMVLMVAPIAEAIGELKTHIPKEFSERNLSKLKTKTQNCKTILLSPRGKVWKQEMAQDYSKLDYLILICGHYEGVDERVSQLVDEEISIGDFVLTGGEIPAMAVVDSIVRLIPGVLEKPDATKNESFSNLASQGEALRSYQAQILEYPQYTKPENFKGQKVPKILLSGDHQKIEEWRVEQALRITKKNRPDLLKKS